jgi:hypothetical protein
MLCQTVVPSSSSITTKKSSSVALKMNRIRLPMLPEINRCGGVGPPWSLPVREGSERQGFATCVNEG